ncbi:MAG: hypothetical protein NVS4B6_24630 [Mycobacterium sp.]
MSETPRTDDTRDTRDTPRTDDTVMRSEPPRVEVPRDAGARPTDGFYDQPMNLHTETYGDGASDTAETKLATIRDSNVPHALTAALEELVRLTSEFGRLTGSLSSDHQAALDNAVHGALDAAIEAHLGSGSGSGGTDHTDECHEDADHEDADRVDTEATLSGTVAELTDRLAQIDDLDTLDDLRNAEERGKNRVSALAAIDKRFAEVDPPNDELDQAT